MLISLILVGLVGMQLNLLDSGTFFFISDHCHVIENVCDVCDIRFLYSKTNSLCIVA